MDGPAGEYCLSENTCSLVQENRVQGLPDGVVAAGEEMLECIKATLVEKPIAKGGEDEESDLSRVTSSQVSMPLMLPKSMRMELGTVRPMPDDLLMAQ